MKTFDERMASILDKGAAEKKQRRNKRIAAGMLAGVFTVALALVLFVPYSTALPDVSRYAGSPYYDVIRNVNKLTYSPPRYKNNFEALRAEIENFGMVGAPMEPAPGDDMAPTMAAPPMASPEGDGLGEYEEVTDNQVEGVIEADLFKRSDKYLYYLNDHYLRIYSIDKEDSQIVGNYYIQPFAGTAVVGDYYGAEMYLTQDCTAVIVVYKGQTKTDGTVTMLVTLDVTDPANVAHKGTVLFTGSFISSRMVGDDVLLTYNYGILPAEVDFDKPETYIPRYGTPGNLQLMDAEDIICPENANSIRYTVVAKVDSANMQVKDTVALLSYSQELYVSRDTIYATHYFIQETEKEDNVYHSVAMTRITGISYTGETLEVLGTVQLEGSVKDQYSMDQYDGILRVATSTMEQISQYHQSGPDEGPMANWEVVTQRRRNCSLYSIDLSTWQIAAAVENFAPDGDEVTSARFDGDKAYICTAEVIVLTDPVYFFDLSDLSNITWTDTGIIDGYSSSLINFGDYLLGIGFGDRGQLKIEAYAQGDGKVESLAAFELDCSFSNNYKAYFIDREKNLVGLSVRDFTNGHQYYLLLHFDGYQFRTLQTIPMECHNPNYTRAAMVDNWLYVLHGVSMNAVPVW